MPGAGLAEAPPPWKNRLPRGSGLHTIASPVLRTSSAGNAAWLARGYPHADGFLVAGGDGTLHEVLQGMDRARQRVLVVPVGRGNSLTRDLGVRTARAGVKNFGGVLPGHGGVLDRFDSFLAASAVMWVVT